jgi:hypothetical protein
LRWRLGLFRLWLAASVLWVGLATWTTYERVIDPPNRADLEEACFNARQADPALGNPWSCLIDGHHPALASFSSYAWDYAALAFLPVLFVLAAGVVGVWVAAGFRRPTTR